jgi:DNA modification methylase
MIEDFKLQTNTIWSFPERGKWLTHKGDYPGNWSPYIPRNVILRYSSEGNTVLDQFVGSGTTIIEAESLNRKAIGCDINVKALSITEKRINCRETVLLQRDARNLFDIGDKTIDLICTHPPYSNIIKYSDDIKEDLSLMTIDDFGAAMSDVGKESYRVLKNNGYCAILMGDTRKKGYIIPIAFNVMNSFLKCGFNLKEIIIKNQHNCRSSEYWSSISIKRNFLLIAHEYLFIFHKQQS